MGQIGVLSRAAAGTWGIQSEPVRLLGARGTENVISKKTGPVTALAPPTTITQLSVGPDPHTASIVVQFYFQYCNYRWGEEGACRNGGRHLCTRGYPHPRLRHACLCGATL